jgi:PKD repeat protein
MLLGATSKMAAAGGCGCGAPTADADGPYGGDEGSPIILDGTGSSDPNDDPLSYIWDPGDGSGTVSGAMPTHTYEDDGTYTVELTVDDGQIETGTDTDSTTATINNVAPEIAPIGDFFTESGGLIELMVSFSDPGILDSPWGFVFDWGDGSPTTTGSTTVMSPISASHSYTGVVGTMFTGTLSITDKDDDTGSRNFNTTITASVPEPATFGLIGAGLAGLGFSARRRRKRTG